MNVSYGYTHSTFKKYDGGTTSSEEQIDYSGNYVPFVPRHTMNAGANYSFFFDKSNWMQSLTLGMSYTGAGKIYWTEKNNVSQSFYGTLNGRISLQTKALQIDVWGRNLTNKDYTTFYFETMHRGFEQKAGLYNWEWIYVITSNHSCKIKRGFFAELPFCFHIYQIKFIFCHTKKSKNFIIAANEANSS